MEIDYLRPSFPVDCTDSEIGLCIPPVPVDFAASLEWCGGASARPAGHRNRAARERWQNPGSGRKEGERGRVGTPYGREDGGRTEEDKSGENWRELDERKGKEGEESWRKRRRKLRKT